MGKKATIALVDFTCLDHAKLLPNGKIQGGSYNVSAYVSGEISDDEAVVIDFSNIKKRLKAIIDDDTFGFDHKLWVNPRYATGVFDSSAIGGGRDTIIGIQTKCMEFALPFNAIRVVSDNLIENIRTYVQKELELVYPNVRGLSVNLYFSIVPNPIWPTEPYAMFRYVHGLKNSTSWGCQNIAHGHLSYIQLSGAPNREDQLMLTDKIANSLNDSIFVWDTNLIKLVGGHYRILYSCSRGIMQMNFSVDEPGFNVCLLKTETTIENIVGYVVDRWKNDLDKIGVQHVFVSEGLTKGAVGGSTL